jgi:hypothetical protein
MVAVMLMSVVLIAGLCVLAYTLAVYALPFMLGVTAAQLSYHTGAGFIGAGLDGLVAAVAAFGVLALLFDTLHSPILRLIVALVFAAPAAVAGYALVHGVTKEAVPSEIWRQIFCIVGGAFVFVYALTWLAGPPEWFTAFTHSRASTDPEVVNLIVVHFAECAALAMSIRPDTKIIRAI